MQSNPFVRYLEAKRTVDDRALNRPVWAELARLVTDRMVRDARPLEVLEIGAGIGTMVERVLAWQLFGPQSHAVRYTVLDADADLIATASARLAVAPPWLDLRFVTADALAYAASAAADGGQRYDLLIANAFLDLVDLRRALPLLRGLLRDGGSFYFTINFDGATLLEPAIDPPLDAAIEAAYHRTMDERITDGQPSGDSRTGRHLFATLPAHGFAIRAAGASDWVVHAVDGAYPADEAAFLRFIVATMEGALRNHPDLDSVHFDRWIAARRAQIDRAKLVYIAHQLDFCGVAG